MVTLVVTMVTLVVIMVTLVVTMVTLRWFSNTMGGAKE